MRKINRKNGAVLVISLIMLLLLTLIGVPAIQTTTLEEKMAGNLRDQNLAFQSAETALRVGEAYLLNTTGLTFTDTGDKGCFYPATPTIPTNWTGNSVCTSVGSVNYRYNIQEIPKGSLTCPGGSLEVGISTPSNVQLYRITARGTDASNNAVVLLQTIYEKC